MKKILFSIFLLSFLWIGASQAKAAETVIYFFWGEGCPHCENQKPFLEEMKNKYSELEVVMLETWYDRDNAQTLQNMAGAYGVQARGVPMTFIGEYEPISGYSDHMKAGIEEKISSCIENGCVNPGVRARIVKEIIPPVQIEEPEPTPSKLPAPLIDIPENKEVLKITDSEKEEISNTEKKEEKEILCLHMFTRSECPQCVKVESIINEMEEKYQVDIKQYNLSYPENEEIYKMFKEKHGLTTASHPIIFLGGRVLIGERAIKENLENEIIRCQSEPCICPLNNIKTLTPFMPKSSEITPEKEDVIRRLPIIGEINFSTMPLFATTALIAFVDGFNPCSLWLIFFLLGMVIHSGSRKKILLVGGIFLLVTGGAYALFMAGLLNVFLYIGYKNSIQIAVGLIALIFALVNIKDYFWYKKGLSFTVSDKYKPGIFKRMRDIMKEGKSSLAVALGTIFLALGVVLVELPCTAGFPVIWTSIIAQNHIVGLDFYLLLALYMLIYLLDEVIVLMVVFFTMKVGRFEEKHGRILKLIGGMIMLALALVMIFEYELMNSFNGSVLVFAAAIVASLAVLLVHRLILPKMGIKVGTEEDLVKAKPSDQPSAKNNND